MDTAADQQLATDLLKVVSHLRRSLRHRWYDYQPVEPLSGSQGELMAVVGGHPGTTVNQAAASLHLAPNTVSALVSQLARLKLLERGSDPGDARLTRLRLTEAGQARRAATRDYRQQVIAAALAQLTREDHAVLAAALPVVRALIAGIEAAGDHGEPGPGVSVSAGPRPARARYRTRRG